MCYLFDSGDIVSAYRRMKSLRNESCGDPATLTSAYIMDAFVPYKYTNLIYFAS